MTVIAYNHKTRTVAIDSQITTGDRKRHGKKFKVLSDGRIVMYSGRVSGGIEAIRRLDQAMELTQAIVSDTTIVVFYPKTGRLEVYEDTIYPEVMRRSYAWGIGGDLALGTLLLGASASQAVDLACAHIEGCGGKVYTFSMEK